MHPVTSSTDFTSMQKKLLSHKIGTFSFCSHSANMEQSSTGITLQRQTLQPTTLATVMEALGGIHCLYSIFKVALLQYFPAKYSPDFPEFEMEIAKELNTWGCLDPNWNPVYRSTTRLQSRVSHKALQSALPLIHDPLTALWQPMGCRTGRGLHTGEGGMRRGIWLPRHQSVRREIVLSLQMGLEQNWELS